MYSSRIFALNNEYRELISFCQENQQISFETYINDIYRKTLLLSSASYFEAVITEAIHDFAKRISNNQSLIALVDNKVLNRQYHTFFDWESKNSNRFLSLFGDTFKKDVREEIKSRSLEENEIAFIAIGRDRNLLVHQNYIEVQIHDTFDEIYNKYQKACDYVDLIVEMLSK